MKKTLLLMSILFVSYACQSPKKKEVTNTTNKKFTAFLESYNESLLKLNPINKVGLIFSIQFSDLCLHHNESTKRTSSSFFHLPSGELKMY